VSLPTVQCGDAAPGFAPPYGNAVVVCGVGNNELWKKSVSL